MVPRIIRNFQEVTNPITFFKTESVIKDNIQQYKTSKYIYSKIPYKSIALLYKS